MIIQDLYTTEAIVKLQPEKNSDLNGVRTYDLCNTVAVLYHLS